MNNRRACIGPLAAIMLALCLSTGAGAQVTDTEPVGAQLVRPICAIDITYVQGSFGTWVWNGTEYEETSGTWRLFIRGSIQTPGPKGCDVAVSFGGLTSQDNISIGPSNFSAVTYWNSAQRDSFGWTDLGYTDSQYDFAFILDSVPSSVPPDTYRGEINIVVANTV